MDNPVVPWMLWLEEFAVFVFIAEYLARVWIVGDVPRTVLPVSGRAVNIFLTLSARSLAPSIRIPSIAHGSSAVPNLRAAGANEVIETEEISGQRIWDIITRPIVTAILDSTLFGQANLNLTELQIPAGSPFIGRQISEFGLENHYNLVLLGILDLQLEEHFVYSQQVQDTQLHAGDILVVIGPLDANTALRRDLSAETGNQTHISPESGIFFPLASTG